MRFVFVSIFSLFILSAQGYANRNPALIEQGRNLSQSEDCKVLGDRLKDLVSNKELSVREARGQLVYQGCESHTKKSRKILE